MSFLDSLREWFMQNARKLRLIHARLNAPTTLTTIELSGSSSVIATHTTTYTGVGKNQNGTVMFFVPVFHSASTSKATIDSSTGVATGVAAGTSSITVTCVNSQGATITSNAITLTTSAQVATSPIAVTPPSFTLAAAATQQLTAVVSDQGSPANVISGASVSWASGTPAKATVNSTGLVTGVAAGSSTITATSGSATGTSAATVTGTGDFPITIAASNYGGDDTAFRAQIRSDASVYSNNALKGTNTNNTNIYSSAEYVDLITLDASVTYNGAATFKEDFPINTAAAPILWYSFPSTTSTLDKVWVRTKIRFASGFTTNGTGSGASGDQAYKLSPEVAFPNYDGRFGVEIEQGTHYSLPGSIQLKSDGSNVCTATGQLGNVVGTEWADQLWYDIIFYYEKLSSSTFRSRYWFALDGNTPVLQATSPGSMVGGNITPAINRVAFTGLNYNRNRSGSQHFTVWRGPTEIHDGTAEPDPFGLGV